MDILFVTTELAPFVKVGGLADVAAALPKALRALGHKVTLVLPRFAAFEHGGLLVARRLTPVRVPLGGITYDVTLFDGRLASQVDIVLVDAPGFYDRAGVYGERGEDYPDNAARFAVLAYTAAEIARQRAAGGAPFDVVHCHDWPAALVPVYMRNLRRESPELGATKTVLTIHNMAHQGIFGREQVAAVGLEPRDFMPETGEFFGKLNLLKLGLVTADAVTTVSPTYARELATESGGAGLDGVVRAMERAITGILNGIDYAVWNPAVDATLAIRYDAQDPSGRARCKGALQRELGLPLEPAMPLIASVGRMVPQKGTDLVAAAMPEILRATDAQIAIAGEGDPELVARIESAVSKIGRARGLLTQRARGGRSSPLLRGRRRARPEPLRAVRARAAVRAALRRAAGRARDRRPRRHRRRLRREARDGHRLPLRGRYAARARRRHRARPRRARGPAVARPREARHAPRPQLGRPSAPLRGADEGPLAMTSTA